MAPMALAQKNWAAPKLVTSDCSGCHGIDGNSQLAYFPNLAGLDAKYAEKKLTAFREPAGPPVDELFWVSLRAVGVKKDPGNVTHTERVNMEGMAHAVDTEVLRQALEWYAKQPPVKGQGGNKPLVSAGQDIYTKGIPAQKTLPCMTCHGPDAAGQGTAPRLAGQHAEYLEGQLVKFRKGDRKHAPEMTMVTRDLDPTQAHTVSLYLQSR